VHPHHAVDTGFVRVEVVAGRLDAVGVGQADGGERVLPPVAALDHGRSEGLGNGRVDLEHDGGGAGADAEAGLDLDLRVGRADAAVVGVSDAVAAGGGVEAAYRHRVGGQPDQAELLYDRHGARVGGDRPDRGAAAGTAEGEERRQADAGGTGATVGDEREAEGRVDDVLPLLLLVQVLGDPVVVGEDEAGRVHDGRAVLLAQHRAAPHHGHGEGLLPGAHGGRVARRQEVLVADDEQDPVTGPPELRESRLARPAPVQPQLAGAEPLGEGDGQQKGLVEVADAQEQPVTREFGVGDEVDEVGRHACPFGRRCSP